MNASFRLSALALALASVSSRTRSLHLISYPAGVGFKRAANISQSGRQ